MKLVLGIVFLFFVSIVSFAQVDDAVVETVDGKKYYVHFVEQGQTLYGIHQKYNVAVGDISRANQGLESGLQIGQKILIPIPLDDVKYYAEHKVVSGETLYGISKKYKCTVQDLKSLNPDLGSDGIKVGQALKVPNLNTVPSKVLPNIPEKGVEKIIQDPVGKVGDTLSVNYTDSIVTHVVLKHETLYAISKRYMVTVAAIKELNVIKKNKVREGDLLKIKVKNVSYEIVENNLFEDTLVLDTVASRFDIIKKDKYVVGLFLPLMLSQNETYLNKPMRVGEVKKLHPTTKIASEFYHGFMLAADSLAQAGLNVEIMIFDTEKDTAKVVAQLNKLEAFDLDLVVGPFYPSTMNVVSRYCKENSLPMVIPFKSSTKILMNNHMVYKATASNMTLMDGAVDFILNEYSHYNVSIVKPSSQADLALYEKARDKFNSTISDNANALNSKIIELSLGNANGRDMNLKLRKDTVNVVIVPSNNLKFISGVFTRLNNVLNLNPYAKNMKIIVFGLEDWNKYNDLDLRQRMRLNQHYASYRYIDYESKNTSKMILSYRKKYGTDPDVYSVQGFDVGYYFLSSMFIYGENFTTYVPNYSVGLVQNDFRFSSESDVSISENGFENNKIKIVAYSNYELVLKN